MGECLAIGFVLWEIKDIVINAYHAKVAVRLTRFIMEECKFGIFAYLSLY